MTTAASSSGTPRPIGAIRPVDGRTIATQRSLDEIPLVGAHDVLRHPHKMAGRSATVSLVSVRNTPLLLMEHCLVGVTMSAPSPLEAGTRHRILRRRYGQGAGRLQIESHQGRSDRQGGHCCHSRDPKFRHEPLPYLMVSYRFKAGQEIPPDSETIWILSASRIARPRSPVQVQPSMKSFALSADPDPPPQPQHLLW